MITPSSPKSRLKAAGALWYSRLRRILRPILNLKFRLIDSSLRNWILIRCVALRLISGRKLVVLYRDIGLGDIVCTFPIVTELKKIFPDHLIVYATRRRFSSFVRKFSDADVTIASSYAFFSRPLPKLPSWVATKAFHPTYFTEGKGDPMPEPRNFILGMADSCALTLLDPHPRIRVSEEDARSALHRFDCHERPRPYVGIHPGPSVPVKEWPFQSWRKLVDLLGQELLATIFQFGSNWHLNYPANSRERLNVHLDLVDNLSVIETTQIISQMDLFIGIDSGLLHIANGIGVPSIGLFGPTNPDLVIQGHATTSLFSGELPCIFCQHRRLNLHWDTGCPFDIECMRVLSAERVFSKAKEMLLLTSTN